MLEALELQNVSLTLKKDSRPLLDNFSFTLDRGDAAALIGEEGDGKSTLLRFIFDERAVDGYCESSGVVVRRGKIAYLPQMLDADTLDMPVCEFFADCESYRVSAALSRFGLPSGFAFSTRAMSTLSGGERIKAQLARIITGDPDVLLLDEPTNDLDADTLVWLENFILESSRSRTYAILFVTHDETLVENTANVIVHMEQLIRKSRCRVTVARCTYSEYISRREHDFEHHTQIAQKQRDDFDKKMERWRKIYERVDHEQRTISRADPSGGRLLKKKMHSVISTGKRFEREREEFLDFPEREDAIITRFPESAAVPAGKRVIELSLPELTVAGHKKSVLARGVSLTVTGGEHVCITGKNGAGKSTLLALIWERLRDRRDVNAAYMPQDYSTVLDFSITPTEHLARNYKKDEITRARTYLGAMLFTHEEMTSPIGALSGGQRAKLLFLDMVLRGSNVLVLDEPTRNFSPLSTPVVTRALYDFRGCIIAVSHDRRFIESCDRVLLLDLHGLHEV